MVFIEQINYHCNQSRFGVEYTRWLADGQMNCDLCVRRNLFLNFNISELIVHDMRNANRYIQEETIISHEEESQERNPFRLLPTTTVTILRTHLSTNPIIFRIIVILVGVGTFLRITRLLIRTTDAR